MSRQVNPRQMTYPLVQIFLVKIFFIKNIYQGGGHLPELYQVRHPYRYLTRGIITFLRRPGHMLVGQVPRLLINFSLQNLFTMNKFFLPGIFTLPLNYI